MKTNLTKKEYILLASMLFGLFFGAGNLIFPVSMGQMAGSSMWSAAIGFCLTGVGLPLLGIASMGISESKGLRASVTFLPAHYTFASDLFLRFW